MTAWRGLTAWTPRRWATAAVTALATVVLVGLGTAMIPNPVFGREIATTWWAWPVLLATGALGGLVAATYVRAPGQERVTRSGVAGGLLAWFAVGCPVCNKIALLALGYAGALQWFAPVQPLLGVAALGLLAWALHQRLKGEVACPVPAAS